MHPAGECDRYVNHNNNNNDHRDASQDDPAPSWWGECDRYVNHNNNNNNNNHRDAAQDDPAPSWWGECDPSAESRHLLSQVPHLFANFLKEFAMKQANEEG